MVKQEVNMPIKHPTRPYHARWKLGVTLFTRLFWPKGLLFTILPHDCYRCVCCISIYSRPPSKLSDRLDFDQILWFGRFPLHSRRVEFVCDQSLRPILTHFIFGFPERLLLVTVAN